MLPPQPFRSALLRRGMAAWIGVRGLLFLAGLPLQLGFYVHLVAAPLISAVAVLIVWLDLRVAREDILLANIGVAPHATLATAAVYPILLEFTAQASYLLLSGAR